MLRLTGHANCSDYTKTVGGIMPGFSAFELFGLYKSVERVVIVRMCRLYKMAGDFRNCFKKVATVLPLNYLAFQIVHVHKKTPAPSTDTPSGT